MGKPTVGEVLELKVDCNDEEIQKKAITLTYLLLKQAGVPTTVSILTVALTKVLTEVLHAETPMPEVNIASVTSLLNDLRGNVLDHVECARNINNVEKKATVH